MFPYNFLILDSYSCFFLVIKMSLKSEKCYLTEDRTIRLHQRKEPNYAGEDLRAVLIIIKMGVDSFSADF